MGFRSTFITELKNIRWPRWFVEKWKDSCWFSELDSSVMASKYEGKIGSTWGDLVEDMQKAINWEAFDTSFIVVFLHECGGITRCQIEKDGVRYSEPIEWEKTNGVTHNYCYGCSDVERIEK